jgi:DnaJ domain
VVKRRQAVFFPGGAGVCAGCNPALPGAPWNAPDLSAAGGPPILSQMRRLLLDSDLSDEADPPVRLCDHPGCLSGGDFRAPKSRLQLRDYYWFCLEHVRAYNAAWNYYAGMSDGEVEAEIRHDAVWQRPSWRLGMRHSPDHAARIRDHFGVLHGDAEAAGTRRRRPAGEAAHRALSAHQQALAVFEIDPPFTPDRLKARYKTLVKLHHPDAHGGDKVAEEKLKIINQAYATLRASYFS